MSSAPSTVRALGWDNSFFDSVRVLESPENKIRKSLGDRYVFFKAEKQQKYTSFVFLEWEIGREHGWSFTRDPQPLQSPYLTYLT